MRDNIKTLTPADSISFPLTGSFGAQAVLVFAVPHAPLAQPWNCIFGNTMAAFIGVSCFKVFNHAATAYEDIQYIASACAVSLTVVAMLLTKSVHPPAGATALIAVTSGPRVTELGYMYMAFPILLGSVLQVLLGIFLNNLSSLPTRSYPTVWLPFARPTLSTPPVSRPSAPVPVSAEDPDKNQKHAPLELESGLSTSTQALNGDRTCANHEKGSGYEVLKPEAKSERMEQNHHNQPSFIPRDSSGSKTTPKSRTSRFVRDWDDESDDEMEQLDESISAERAAIKSLPQSSPTEFEEQTDV